MIGIAGKAAMIAGALNVGQQLEEFKRGKTAYRSNAERHCH